MTKGQLLAEFACNLRYNNIPKEVINKAKYHIMDNLGVALVASKLKFSKALVSAAKEDGGGRESTIIGYGDKVSISAAALVNGSLAHGVDFDDSHSEAVLHPSSSTVPTAMAFGEKLHANGKRIIESVVAGLEIVIRIGSVAPNQFHAKGFHATAVCGTFGAAATASKVLGLDRERISRAMGIAGSQAAGIFEYLTDGSWIKRAHPGWAAHSGSWAALLAKHGFTGPHTVFEGRFGLFNTHIGEGLYNIENLTRGLGKEWETLNIIFKPYPCCHYNHACIDCSLEILRANELKAENIESVECIIAEEYVPIICEPAEVKYKPPTPYGARFSLPFAIALALLFKEVKVMDFEKQLNNSAVLKMARKINYSIHKNSGFPKVLPGWVKIKTVDGHLFEHKITDTKGSPKNPLTADELKRKFMRNSEGILSPKKAEHAIEMLEKLEKTEDIGVLMKLLGAKKLKENN